jgi:Secretion system C-terminal sorting domain
MRFVLASPLLGNKQGALLLAFLMTCLNCKAQIVNYVSNGGFEEVSPTATLTFLYDGFKYWGPIDTLKGAYYMVGELPPMSNAPNCSYGFQYPRNGNNFMLTQFYCNACPRWYPRNRLKQPLKAGVAYCVKYYVVSTNNSVVAIDNYAAYFGDSSMDTITKCTIPLTYLIPQIENTPGNIITDTLKWIPIKGIFVASGNEKYMALGNFKSNVATNTLLVNPPTPIMGTDVYIDDVSVIELNLPAFAGRDTFFVPGNSLFIGRQPDVGINDACTWYKLPNLSTPIATAIAGFSVTPLVTTTYVVRQDICGLVKWDSVVLTASAVGIKGFMNDDLRIKIYPNPANDILVLEALESTTNYQCRIYNSIGYLIREEEIMFKDNTVKLNVNDLESGVYSLQLKSEGFGTASKRFVINR